MDSDTVQYGAVPPKCAISVQKGAFLRYFLKEKVMTNIYNLLINYQSLIR